MAFEEELDVYLRARFTLLVLVTTEEERALQSIRNVCERTNRPAVAWDIADNFQVFTTWKGPMPTARDPLSALEQADSLDVEAVWVLKDFHEAWDNAQVKRKLRSLAQRFKRSRKSLIITSPSSKVPEELKDDAVVVHFPPPTHNELEAILNQLSQTPGVKLTLTDQGRDRLVEAAMGLSVSQAQRVFAQAIVSDGILEDADIGLVTEAKRQTIRESEALEFCPSTQTIDEVGGLSALKDWLRLRERAFTKEARAYGLPAPKGILLIGIPGTGKSLTAKMISGLWHLPLIRLDVGSLYGSLVGESEERTRRALRLVGAVAPCIVWIDEVEKAMSHGDLDSGTSTRVFGSILTWMQEKTEPCFVVATANDVASLPPEFMRKGRFDEIFFLDLPSAAEREEIFDVHLRKRRRQPESYDVPRLALESDGYVGAEIEQAIVDAMFVGFNANREFNGEDISHALRRQVPLSVSQRETVEALRGWLREGRAQSASAASWLETGATPSTPDIEVRDS
jgi:AAA+ superfamily predicted ATPase